MGSSEAVQRLEQAVHLAERGHKLEAEALLRELVAEGSRIPKAFMALGVLCGERGDLAQRRLWLQQARQLEADATPDAPPSLRLLLNLVVDGLEQGEPERALPYAQEATAHYPEDGEAHLYQARALFDLGKREEARPHLDQACTGLRTRLAGAGEDAKTWRLLAMAEHNAERVDAAIEAYGRALEIEPNHLPSLLTISRLLVARGQIDRAMPWLMNALAVSPENPDVLSLNGCALKAIGEPEQAIHLFRQALAIQPGHLEACLMLGSCLWEHGFFAEAAQAMREGVESSQGNGDARSGLAAAQRSMGDLEGAAAIYKELLEELPHAQGAFSNLMFTYSISSLATPEEVLATARHFWAQQGVDPDAAKPSPLRVEGRPLRVGLLSGDIGSHVVGRFLDSLLRHHDPSRCQLELISLQRRYEACSEALISLSDGFHSLEGLPSSQAKDLLRQQEYDLIVDTSGYTAGSGLHLLADRCAPVQAHYIGYHATTGLATMDWFIGDHETAAPELQDQFSEQLYRLPRPWLAYPSNPSFPDAQALMQTDRPVLGSFCQVAKISEPTLNAWAEALTHVPEALLVLKDKGLQDALVRERITQGLTSRGVDPERLRLLSPVGEWRDHVDYYNILDVALDTTPWSSATTAFEALAMGVPLIAIRGNCMAARMSSSLVRGIGKPEWIGDADTSVGAIARELCQNLEALRSNKKSLQEDVLNGCLFDGAELSRVVQDAFLDMANPTS